MQWSPNIFSICLVFYLLFFTQPKTTLALQSSDQVSITAQVPLTYQHIMGIQKNSRLESSIQTHSSLKQNDTLDVRINLLGLKDTPQRNREVSVLLLGLEDDQQITITQTSTLDGFVQFSIPVTYALTNKQYSISFHSIVENTKIDLFSATLITIIRPIISHSESVASVLLKTVLSPLENTVKVTYSTALIFATLIWIKKTYGFAKEIFVTPAAISAAARDGPISICGASKCCNKRSNTFSG